jgi:hypothetical protein
VDGLTNDEVKSHLQVRARFNLSRALLISSSLYILVELVPVPFRHPSGRYGILSLVWKLIVGSFVFRSTGCTTEDPPPARRLR